MDSTSIYSFTKTARLPLLLLFSVLLLAGCKDSAPPSSQPSPAVTAASADSTEPVAFWVATDTHYLDKALQDGGQAFQTYVTGGDGKMLPYSDELAEALVYDVERKQPDFLILSGDLTNNGEASSHTELAAKLRRIEDMGTSVYVIPGNHDINNPWARSFDGDKQVVAKHINAEDFVNTYADYGYNEAISRDTDSLSYLVKAAPKLWLLMIDSAQYAHNEEYNFPQTDGRILPSTLSWMDDCVKLAAQEHASIITVMHHNLLSHTSMAVSGFKLNNSQETMKTLRKDGLNLVLSGHIHMQDIRRDPAEDSIDPALPVYDIATGAMAVNPHQYGAMTFDPLSRAVTYTATAVDVEAWAKANNNTDPNLLNFKSYAEKSFADASYGKAMNRLAESTFSEEEKQSMAEVMSELNVKYFAGTAADSLDKIKAMPGFTLWESMEGGFMSGYIRSMAEHSGQSNVSLEMVLTTQ
ncbi:metallophosphoesterase [Paenibacillus sp. MMS20-IR301]|uniref:metallophosphoesterase n=1 Tax=Paenibacillus sp. MMS20-IR301 TaxID=2895946 RepID=UPI0028E5B66D|nr:metallophosphoesterase [Paenibacillus sp. MMS20-IR301]WNS45710.1 metallophosphoesterase [Paenibacillus sp. MMS20-IR301]